MVGGVPNRRDVEDGWPLCLSTALARVRTRVGPHAIALVVDN